MAAARSPLGGAFEVIPVRPPWLCTSTEMCRRSTSSAAELLSAASAAAVDPEAPPAPASIAGIGISGAANHGLGAA